MSKVVEVSFQGVRQVHDMLAQFMEPTLTKRAQRATKAGAKVLAPPLREAVRPLSRRMAASVYVHIAKRERPAYVVGHHRKTAFFWHMVIGGTKAHSTAARDGHRSGPFVRGVPAHPVIREVATAHEGAAYDAIVTDLMKDH